MSPSNHFNVHSITDPLNELQDPGKCGEPCQLALLLRRRVWARKKVIPWPPKNVINRKKCDPSLKAGRQNVITQHGYIFIYNTYKYTFTAVHSWLRQSVESQKNASTLDKFEIAPGSAVGAHGWHDSPLRDVDKDQLRDIGTWTCTRDTSTGMAGIEERKKVTTCQTLTDPVTKEISYSKAYVDRLS